MNIIAAAVIGIVIGLLIGGVVQYQYQKRKGQTVFQRAQQEVRRAREMAEADGERIRLEAKDDALAERERVEEEIKERRKEINREEDRLVRRRESLDNRLEKLEQREQRINKRQSNMDKRANELEKAEGEYAAELERIAGMSVDEAKQELLQAVEQETRIEMGRRVREIEAEVQQEADERAREIIADSIQRIASDAVSEMTVSIVPLPSDDMKGRIIGRNGRNIRAFEQVAGVDVVVDDTPEAITISSFDPVRREIARRAMQGLVLDGRIHPARIEKLVADSEKEVDRIIVKEGQRACDEIGVSRLHPELVKLIGRLKFRTSYGQNQLAHAIETAHLAGILATELGANQRICKLGGLLHDIGKAVDHEVEGTHAQIGAEICRRYGVGEEVANAIESHHHETDQNTVEAVIVEAADAISGARPGARRESLENYIKRVKALEDLTRGFDGVSESYALQAGREVRIIVRPEDVDDFGAIQLSKDIAKKIEEGLQYPGQIKVTIIRETRAVDYAK